MITTYIPPRYDLASHPGKWWVWRDANTWHVDCPRMPPWETDPDAADAHFRDCTDCTHIGLRTHTDAIEWVEAHR